MKTYLHLAIHDLHSQEGLGPQSIAKRLGIPLRTVERHLAQPRCPEPATRRRPSQLEPFRPQIMAALDRGLNGEQVLRHLREAGYQGGRSILMSFIRAARPPVKEAFLTLKFEPGQNAQVDFAECGLVGVGEERRKLYAFLMILGHSRRIFVRFILRMNTEHFLACHREAFEHFDGVPREIMVDNCKVAVVHGKAMFGPAVINPRYAELAAHYGFRPVPCNVRSPHEKGRVERAVGYLRTNFLNGMDTAGMTLAAVNAAASGWMEEVADVRPLKGSKDTPALLFPAEQAGMLPLPRLPGDCSVRQTVRITRQCRISFEGNRYSAPMACAGREAELVILPETLRLVCDGQTIAEHRRCFGHGQTLVIPAHDLELVKRRQRAAKAKAIELFLGLSRGTAAYYQELCRRRPDAFLHVARILALISEYGQDQVVDALDGAMQLEAFGAEYIANLLAARRHRHAEPSPLQLTHKRDCLDLEVARPDLDIYDQLT